MDAKERESSMEAANQSSIYINIVIGVIVGIVGVFLRFAYDSRMLSIISWAILAVGTILACKAVFRILNAK
ncbi:hypothetical protein [Pedobacter montanisoli]|uniref:AtpZ/AtpI family protein n=1 Tax=Pedobacter montanisoli TaxID=2923277 RepID=A0ABS9ZRR5_9SPHI|nr:hypothetical protein [Pedobacter montanisoli]MCJ0741290.1 hypothetical protein [Pedobacter montanisoli]